MSANAPSATPPSRSRSRAVLLLIAAMFIAPFAIAVYLYYTGWQPSHTKNYGEMLHPPRDLRDVRFTRADGSPFAWNHEDHMWRLLVAPPADCGASCDKLADALHRIWIGLGNNADSLQVLWVGVAPKPAFRSLIVVRADASFAARLPDAARPDAIPVYLVDPSGYLFLRYKPDFEPGKMRRDLQQLTQQNM
jgi:cytochrome oxidase Cu insertion factor (SCO1/SenC/PrrC family)